jgi:hypothetical protein
VPRFPSIDGYLVDATLSLPAGVAAAMEEALAGGDYLIRAGSYARAGAMCPLGAADAHSRNSGLASKENSGLASKAGSSEGSGGELLRFAVSFDLYAAEVGDEAATAVVVAALEKFRSCEQQKFRSCKQDREL